MEKRYQVFISSTFRDLVDERQAVLKAILELDHMPAGMELFPATDDSAWQLIKDIIDASDYYVLIMGGRYGSLDEAGLGYTEKEYDHAISTKKPVIALLHKNPDNLPRDRTEVDLGKWEKLKAFRTKVEKRHTCVYWNAAEDLKAHVIVGMTAAVKRHPGIGWIRADQVPSDATLAELLTLRKRLADLEKEMESSRTGPPEGVADLVQGDELFLANAALIVELDQVRNERRVRNIQVPFSWNEMFASVAPLMLNICADSDLREGVDNFIKRQARTSYKLPDDVKRVLQTTISARDIETCIIQLRALGLIKESTKQRSVKDTNSYWELTPHGDSTMVKLRAIRRHPSNSSFSQSQMPVQEVATEYHNESKAPTFSFSRNGIPELKPDSENEHQPAKSTENC